jgi:hypothetical protein
MFRRKRTPADPVGEPGNHLAAVGGAARPLPPANDLQAVFMKVVQSFLVDAPRPMVTPQAFSSGSSYSQSPYSSGTVAPPPLDAPGAAFVGEVVGGDASAGGSSGRSLNIPGMGVVSSEQLHAAEAKAQSAIQEALGSSDLSRLTPEDVGAVRARLETMRASGRITDQQYAALNDGLAVLGGSSTI